MEQTEFSFTGRVEPGEVSDVVALIARAAAGGRITGGVFTIPANEAVVAAADALMSLHGTHRDADGESRFPVVTRLLVPSGQRSGAVRTVRVEMHPSMRHEAALPGLMAHLVGGTAGRLLRRLWGRWGVPVSEPTEQLMDALGTGHHRFTQFRELLEESVARIRAVTGASVTVEFERAGRGAKVIRIRFAVEAPRWLDGGASAQDDPSDSDAPPRLGRQQRKELYTVLKTLVGGAGASPLSVMQSLSSLPPDGDDATMAEVCRTAVSRMQRLPIARALRGMVPSSEIAWGDVEIDGLYGLAERVLLWDAASPGGERASRAWVIEAVTAAVAQSLPLDGALRQMRRALQADIRDGWIHPDDAKAALDVVEAFDQTLRSSRFEAEIFSRLIGPKASAALSVLWEAGSLPQGVSAVTFLMGC